MQRFHSSLLRTHNLINGKWVDAPTRFKVDNPATQETLAEVADCTPEQAQQAIDAAYTAFVSWQQVSPLERSNLLWRWYELVMAHQEELAMIMTAEQGKALAESRGEVAYGASYIRWFSEEARRIHGDVIRLPQADRRGIVIHQPVGVVAAITPWNFPNAMITRKVAPALAAGCTVVLKPAAETPLSALALAELALQAGIPAGVFNIINSSDAPTLGKMLSESPKISKLTFTGSTAVGKLLLQQCAPSVKRTSMELGGNAPIIIFDDADIEQAVQGTLAAKFRNSGQTCICANRILVQANIAEEFTQRLCAAVKQFRLGNGAEASTTHGPLISAKAVNSVAEKVNEAVQAGAQVLLGGRPSDLGECFYEPTILSQVSADMRIWRDEIFGPVAPIMTFDTDEEAINAANDTRAGLAAYLYTQNHSRMWKVGEALQYGMVGVNETAISSEMIPFGGVKESGLGREGSRFGLQDYLNIKYLCMGGL